MTVKSWIGWTFSDDEYDIKTSKTQQATLNEENFSQGEENESHTLKGPFFNNIHCSHSLLFPGGLLNQA
jgi:hypothetical protein